MLSSIRRDMICDIKNRYFSITRIMLLMVGLWPYQQSKLVRLQAFVFFAILASFIFFQLTTFMTSECTPDLIIKVISCLVPCSSLFVMCNAFWINMESMKSLLEELQRVCNQLRDQKEICIIEKYGSKAKYYTIMLTLLAMSGIFAVGLMTLFPQNVILSLILAKDSHSHEMSYITTEYFIDREKYFYLIRLHMIVAVCTGSMTSIAVSMTFLVYFQHTCGVFRIASYRIERALKIDIMDNINKKNVIIIQKKISYAVDIHRKAMELSTFLISTFHNLLFIMIILQVTCLTLSLFRVCQIISFSGDTGELLFHITISITITITLFLANYIGQEIKDHNTHVFTTVYNVRWYIAPVRAQKLILFLLQRGNKDFTLTIGGLFVGSLECYATLISASVSYFTVMYSTQK